MRIRMKINLPEQVNYIIKHLSANGFEAYAVGGCIRDTILGKIPGDWDITTSATPYEVKALFRRTVDTGIQHGTVLVLMEDEGYEITTYRIDGDYEDNRHPKEVAFTKTLHADLKRRDFTINAMAYNEESGLVDEFGGIHDIREKKISCVGNPMERFQEDALRILRAFRFSGQLGFQIEANTLAAASKYAANLETISSERIRDEINKLLLSDAPERMMDAYLAGITPFVLPEFDRMMLTNRYDQGSDRKTCDYSLAAIKQAKRNLKLRLALFLHLLSVNDAEAAAEEAKSILQRLHFDNETVSIVSRLIQHQKLTEEMLSPSGMRKTIYVIGADLMELLFDFWGTIAATDSFLMMESATTLLDKEDKLGRAKSLYLKIQDNQDCTSLKTLAISGRDLIQLGYSPGKELGNQLLELLELVLDHPEQNKKELLLKIVQNH